MSKHPVRPTAPAPPESAATPQTEAGNEAGAEAEEEPEVPELTPEQRQEQIERRRYVRPLPVAQVVECDDEEAWQIWSQWSNL